MAFVRHLCPNLFGSTLSRPLWAITHLSNRSLPTHFPTNANVRTKRRCVVDVFCFSIDAARPAQYVPPALSCVASCRAMVRRHRQHLLVRRLGQQKRHYLMHRLRRCLSRRANVKDMHDFNAAAGNVITFNPKEQWMVCSSS